MLLFMLLFKEAVVTFTSLSSSVFIYIHHILSSSGKPLTTLLLKDDGFFREKRSVLIMSPSAATSRSSSRFAIRRLLASAREMAKTTTLEGEQQREQHRARSMMQMSSRAASNVFASCSKRGGFLNGTSNSDNNTTLKRFWSSPFSSSSSHFSPRKDALSGGEKIRFGGKVDFGRSQTRQSFSGTCRWSGGGGGASLETAKRVWQKDTYSLAPRTMFIGTQVRTYAKSLSQMKEAGLKAYKPTTPGFRGRVITDRSKLWKGKPLKALTKGLTKSGGRNNHGRITVWHKGGGHKRLYRVIDFKRDLFGVNGVIRRIEYDPNRTTRIALVDYPDGIKPRYILAPDGAKAGDVISSRGGQPADGRDPSSAIDVRPGNAMPLSEMPIGTIVHNVELVPGRGGALARSAGASATLVKKGADGYCAIKLPSGELRLVPSKCVATVGVLSNREHQNTNMGKAGAKRWKGVRPTVRGTAMNPIDHPHGGGEGRSKGGNQSVSPWGVNTKGKRTRNNKRTDNMRLQRRPMNRKRYPLLAK